MALFDETIGHLHAWAEGEPRRRTWQHQPAPWPAGGPRNLVFRDTLAVELGAPQHGSVSALLWSADPALVRGDTVTLVGPDLAECRGRSLPFGKVALVAVRDFDPENTYEHYRRLEQLRYHLDLKGFMLRAVSQYRREWCRISHEALARGFSLHTLGSALIRALHTDPAVISAEVIFTTTAPATEHLNNLTDNAAKIIAAMCKMNEELSLDCDDCDYQDVCNDATELQSMRRTLGGRLE